MSFPSHRLDQSMIFKREMHKMNIQKTYSSYGTQLLNQINPQKVGLAPRTDSGSAQKVDSSFGSSDTVTISSSAMALATSESQGVPRTPAQEKLINSLKNDQAGAEKIAEGWANESSRVLYDISDGNIRIASTGELMEDESVREAYTKNFEAMASKIDSQIKFIYSNEKSKGTPASEIVAKMIDFKNSQPQEYIEAAGIGLA